MQLSKCNIGAAGRERGGSPGFVPWLQGATLNPLQHLLEPLAPPTCAPPHTRSSLCTQTHRMRLCPRAGMSTPATPTTQCTSCTATSGTPSSR